jgi:protein kinase-like protein
MGTVYVAHDPVLGRMVAIKVFAGDLDVPDARERFSREARAAAALNHPNIVTVYDFGEYGSQPYIVMEYVPGETMANLIRRKVPVSIADKLRWMQELCAGAGYAHQMSVIHRDIKPANLMIDRSGRLKILDFGIARMLGLASNTTVMIGTPGYMAPEQITGDPVDHRSDQFSIGVVFYELLAYSEPFPGDTLPAITHRILNEHPKPLLGMAADVTPEVAAIVDQAIKKNISDRFPDTEAMRSAIAKVRRQFNSDESWGGTTTMPLSRDITPPGGLNRGTGSARRRTGNAVGVAQLTPPPDPRRTDREALARRRAAQVDAALAQARQLVAQQQLEAALDACQQALTLDENHVAALELEREIETALGLREGVAMPADDPDVTVASDPSTLDPRLQSQAVTRMHDDGYAVAGGVPSSLPGERALTGPPPLGVGAGERTVLRPAIAVKQDPSSVIAEPTIIAPSRRTPPPARATKPATGSSAAPPPAPPAVAKQPAKTPAPGQKSGQKVPVQKAPSGPDLLTRMTSAVAPVVRSLQSLPATLPKGQARTIALVAAAVVVVAIAATAYFLTRGPAPTGTLVIEAAPWATVTAIRAENGSEQMLPPSPSTPLSITLPEGTYQITLTGPDAKTATVSAHVSVGGVAVAPMTRFETMSVEQYFEQYLGSAGGATEVSSPASPGDAAAPAAPVVPASTGAPSAPGGRN